MKIAAIQLERHVRAYDLLLGSAATPAIPSVPSSWQEWIGSINVDIGGRGPCGN